MMQVTGYLIIRVLTKLFFLRTDFPSHRHRGVVMGSIHAMGSLERKEQPMRSRVIHYFILYSFLICTLVLCLVSRGYGDCWKVKTTIPRNDTSRIWISFCDSLNGMAVVDTGLTWTTTNGGITWLSPNTQNSGIRYSGIYMLDYNNALLLTKGNAVSIMRTTNHGLQWQSTTTWGYALYGISFSTSLKGIAVGEKGVIFQTSNGGYEWTKKTIGTVDQTFTCVTYLDSMNIIVAGGSSILYRSRDEGITWTQSMIGPLSGIICSITFSDSLQGIVGSSSGSYARTTDGGQTWHLEVVPMVNILNDFSYLNNERCVAVGRGTVSKSYDSGKTWQTIKLFNRECSKILPLTERETNVLCTNGNILVNTEDSCTYGVSLNYPVNGAINIPFSNNQHSVMLRWGFELSPLITASHIQISTDPSFSQGLIANYYREVTGTPFDGQYAMSLNSNTTYYWRVALKLTDDTEQAWSKVHSFTTMRRVITGMVYDDTNRDGQLSIGEMGMFNQLISISGGIHTSIITDSAGVFIFGYPDSGNYTFALNIFGGWVASTPLNVHVQVGLDDSVGGIVFGQYYPWASLGGKVYHDINENGIFDIQDSGMVNMPIRIKSTTGELLTYSNATGEYIFDHLEYMACSVFVATPVGWEKITPRLVDAYTFEAISLGQHYEQVDFGIHPIPDRVKIPISFYISPNRLVHTISLGVREEATYGIWDTNPLASNIDFSEGEAELPYPYSFFLDVRFINPDQSQSLFGYGSWVDMRPLNKQGQIDTYRVYFNGIEGDQSYYPVKFRWSKELISQSYSGPVSARTPLGIEINMKAVDSLVFNDSNMNSLVITASSPVLEYPEYTWLLVSLPYLYEDSHKDILFPTSKSNAFLFDNGYRVESVMKNGIGYWMKFWTAELPVTLHGLSLHEIAVPVKKGWNLIGSVDHEVPIPTDAIIESNVYGYENGYTIASIIEPGHGYWVKVSSDSELYLGSTDKVEKHSITTDHLNSITVTDNDGKSQTLYYGEKGYSLEQVKNYEMPPCPPSGVFDARFASQRIIELIDDAKEKTLPIQITSQQYPVKISWHIVNSSIRSSIMVGNTIMIIEKDGSTFIESEDERVSLQCGSRYSFPVEYALEQNYPNPFNPSTVINYSIPDNGNTQFAVLVQLRVYNMLGQEIATLVNEVQSTGYKSVIFNSSSLSSGMYFYKMIAGEFSALKKMVVMR